MGTSRHTSLSCSTGTCVVCLSDWYTYPSGLDCGAVAPVPPLSLPAPPPVLPSFRVQSSPDGTLHHATLALSSCRRRSTQTGGGGGASAMERGAADAGGGQRKRRRHRPCCTLISGISTRGQQSCGCRGRSSQASRRARRERRAEGAHLADPALASSHEHTLPVTPTQPRDPPAPLLPRPDASAARRYRNDPEPRSRNAAPFSVEFVKGGGCAPLAWQCGWREREGGRERERERERVPYVVFLGYTMYTLNCGSDQNCSWGSVCCVGEKACACRVTIKKGGVRAQKSTERVLSDVSRAAAPRQQPTKGLNRLEQCLSQCAVRQATRSALTTRRCLGLLWGVRGGGPATPTYNPLQAS